MQQQSFFTTPADIAAEFKEKLSRGHEGDCPACGRFCKVYHRRIHSNMARQLIALYRIMRATEKCYVHTRDVREVCGYSDFTLAKHWGMVVAKPNLDEPTKKETGQWTLTVDGLAFVRDGATVPKYVYLFDDRAQGFSEELVTIRDCLGKKFNYAELMG